MPLIVVLIFLITITGFPGVAFYKIGIGQKDICLTPQCVHMASTALELMDLSVDPCEDFYNFTCGNFLKTANIPDDKSEISLLLLLKDLVADQLRIVFEQPIKDDEVRAFRLVKEMYQACMNITLLEEIGLTEVKEMVKKVGGWPVLEGSNWKEGDFDWKETVYKFRKEGFSSSYLIHFYIGEDRNNSSRKIINLDKPTLGLDRKYLINGLEHKLVKSYYDLMVDVAVIFGANKAIVKEELLELLKFEIGLAKISLSKEERLDLSDLPRVFTINELQNKYPSIPWLDYINNILSPEASVKTDEIILVISPKFFSELEKLMSVTSKRVQSNYLFWRAVKGSIVYLTKELRTKILEYNSVYVGTTSESPRWKHCLLTINNELTIVAGAMYVRNYFDKERMEKVKEIFDNTKDAFRNILENLDWMDEETRYSALKKLSSMKVHAGYPAELLDDEKIDKYFREYEVDKTKFWKSILNSKKFYTKEKFSEFRQPYNKTYWTYYSNTVTINAYLTASTITQLNAAILQDPFFNKDYPEYINYGGIGNVIGHELTHGFDIYGRFSDADGNLNDWWANKTSEAYNKKTKCMIHQYNNYTVPELKMNINGLVTLAENIADIGGIKEAYYAYLNVVEENGKEPSLPGLSDYNGRQMFWIATGLPWCTKSRIETMKHRVMLDSHAPDRYRAWGRVSNMEEFAKDFNCKPNSKMNPVEKCQIW